MENLNESFEKKVIMKDIMKAFSKDHDAVVDPAKLKDEWLMVKEIMSTNYY